MNRLDDLSRVADLLLVGAGSVAVAHARVLAHLGVRSVVVGRGEPSARSFEEQTGLPVVTGGLEAALAAGLRLPRRAVVAVPVPDLAAVTSSLLRAGVEDVLVEKPAGLDRREIAVVAALATRTARQVHVAYNRRFHVSTALVRRLAAEDGGVRSFTFDFTERSHVVESLAAPAEVKEGWLLANSSHVIDLAFHLGGAPVQLTSTSRGNLPWHARGAVFAGSGITQTSALFAYVADWGGPGGWRVELTTARRRLLLAPLERLSVADRDSPVFAPYPADYEPDMSFKPGFLEQMRSFLGDGRHLPDIHEHLSTVERVIEPLRDGSAPGAT